MSTLKLVFTDADTIPAKVIRLATWSDVCHVGLVDNKSVIDSRYSSHGVSEYPIAKLGGLYPRILVREYDIEAEPVLAFARSQIGKPYDLSAVIGIPFHRDWQEDDKWFCAEVIAWAANMAKTPLVHKKSGRVTPQDLFQVPFISEWIGSGYSAKISNN